MVVVQNFDDTGENEYYLSCNASTSLVLRAVRSSPKSGVELTCAGVRFVKPLPELLH